MTSHGDHAAIEKSLKTIEKALGEIGKCSNGPSWDVASLGSRLNEIEKASQDVRFGDMQQVLADIHETFAELVAAVEIHQMKFIHMYLATLPFRGKNDPNIEALLAMRNSALMGGGSDANGKGRDRTDHLVRLQGTVEWVQNRRSQGEDVTLDEVLRRLQEDISS